jgi:stearoyl-CoA desaturase (delta-9 desaturase)
VDLYSQARSGRAHDRAAEMLRTSHLPQLPTREDFLAEAKAMFARTRSLDEIAGRAYEILLASVGSYLAAPIRQQA